MHVLKIGGAALTDKHTGRSYVEDVAVRVAKELKPEKRYVIVHGVGYEGHHLAKKYSLHKGLQDNQWQWAHVRVRVKEITRSIVNILVKHGHPAVEVSTADILKTWNGRIVYFNLETIREFLEKGFIPVMHSDGAIDEKLGLVVVSGDTIATDIALRLGAKKLIYGTDVDGVLDSQGNIIPRLRREDLDSLDIWEIGDFSGGMKKKIEESMRTRNLIIQIINLRKDGMLARALNGESVGTIIEG